VVHGHLADAEIVPRRSNVDAEDLVHVGRRPRGALS
jgi:hypothetical protein